MPSKCDFSYICSVDKISTAMTESLVFPWAETKLPKNYWKIRSILLSFVRAHRVFRNVYLFPCVLTSLLVFCPFYVDALTCVFSRPVATWSPRWAYLSGQWNITCRLMTILLIRQVGQHAVFPSSRLHYHIPVTDVTGAARRPQHASSARHSSPGSP